MSIVTFLLSVLIVLAIVGLILWAVRQIPGIPPIVLTILYVVVGILLLLWLLEYVQSGAHLFPLK